LSNDFEKRKKDEFSQEAHTVGGHGRGEKTAWTREMLRLVKKSLAISGAGKKGRSQCDCEGKKNGFSIEETTAGSNPKCG